MTDIEIMDMRYRADSSGRFLSIDYQVEGNTWIETRAHTEFINQDSGEKKATSEQKIYCLPGDRRKQYIPLPDGLPSGSYIASVMLFYGEDSVKAAEMELDI